MMNDEAAAISLIAMGAGSVIHHSSFIVHHFRAARLDFAQPARYRQVLLSRTSELTCQPLSRIGR
jgi:hypothetical protein